MTHPPHGSGLRRTPAEPSFGRSGPFTLARGLVDLKGVVKRHWPWALIPILVGMLLTSYRYLEVLSDGGTEPLIAIVSKEMSGAIGTMVLLWPMIWIHRRARRSRGLTQRLGVHLVGVVGYSVIHTSWNWGARSLLYPLFGLGTYDYGRMPTRYFMEAPLDLIVYAFVGVLVLILDRAEAARQKELQMVTLQEQLQRTQLAQLQSQLRPHFLFNSLNTVSAVMYEDVDKADGVLQALSDILRRMVDQSDAVTVPLDEELNLIRSAVEIMEARFQDRLRVDIAAEADTGRCLVPPLLLQPLVENSMQHAAPEDGGILDISVRASKAAGRLRLDVIDNGPGLNGSPSQSSNGVGLRNTRERLETQYGDAATMTLSDLESGGLHVTIEIPWIRSEF